MKCPNCSAPAADGAAECPSCGLMFAKWREKLERERLAAEAFLAAAPAAGKTPAAAPLRPWIVGVAATLFWMACLGWWYMRHPARVPARGAAQEIGRYVELRDPATGDLRRMRIERAGSPPPAVPAAAPKENRTISEASWVEEVSTAPAR